ncbi:YdcF family protein [Candidatus Desantisbacteria bacterium]|nr:YdcF family protein [Candidatus Desantisbacteria bacterium]
MKRYFNKLKIRYVLLLLLIFFIPVLVFMDNHISESTKNKLFYSSDNIPHTKVALILGTRKDYFGRPNSFYEYRLDAAAQLWNKNKIDAILISGDNSKKEYDEPSEMKKDLIKRGIPEECINLDFAGFSTFDSIVRANKIFGINDYVVISQAFHCERAIYIANKLGCNVIGYCASDVENIHGIKVRFREMFARVKTIIDLYFIKKQPKFLGEKEIIKFRDTNK